MTSSPYSAGVGVQLAGEAVFVPGDPARLGAFVFYDLPTGVTLTGSENTEIELVLPTAKSVRKRTVAARRVPLDEAIPALLAIDRESATPSLAGWSVATTAAVGLIARGRLLPAASVAGYDEWRVGPLDPSDVAFLHDLAAALPPQAHALPLPGTPLTVRSAAALIRDAWDAIADTLARTAGAPDAVGSAVFADRDPQRVDGLGGWLAESGGSLEAGARLVLRVELPSGQDMNAHAALQLRSAADPSLVMGTDELWRAPAFVLGRFGESAETDLLLALRRGARVWAPMVALLREATPTALELDDDGLEDLLGDTADALAATGIEVLWPAELLTDGLQLGATVSTPTPSAVTSAGFTLEELLDFRWQLTLGGEVLREDEVALLAEAKRPLVRLRGRWVTADPALIARLRARRRRRVTAVEALAAALTGSLDVDGESIPFTPPPALASLARKLSGELIGEPPVELPSPPGLQGSLRPYQHRGFCWLVEMAGSGLGGCLADDMGLGKTVQVIALHLHLHPHCQAAAAGPTLVVCPTSLLGNWQRELARFAPEVPVRRFHGGDRHLQEVAADEVVLVTYGVVRRDCEELAGISWGLIVADEAQHVKNPLSRTARDLRAVPAAARIALTGTPVENRLTDLWAILDWTTPGLLGPLERFRRGVAVPIERYGDPDTTARLGRLTRPFLLRRRKSDPGIAPELPPKTETDQIVALTAEQATLYEAVVRETMAQIRAAEGIARRGLVLKLLTALKQICNHPAQYLHQAGPLVSRSGKLAVLEELLDIITAAGDSVLVFTQYVKMARLIESHLTSRGIPTLFLHGSVPVRRREDMVSTFQSGTVPVFLLSLKAGGVGLNLTRATHVIHYDRWWNPAVEDQATDRAYRIGQDRSVQVHRLVAEGTLEDKIAALLARKRELADAVVGSGEGWLAELSDADLADLVSLGSGS